MKRLLNKVVALVILFELVGINFLVDAVYANSIINEGAQTSAIVESEERISFNANINNSNNTIANIEGENNLNLNLALNSGGFLKDVRIVLEGNNYSIAQTAEEINKTALGDKEITNVNKVVRMIEGNEILLKELDGGEKVDLSIPIKFNKGASVSKKDMEAESTIKMVATYTNGQNKESEETKEVNQHLKWTTRAEEEVSQKLVRYLKYDNRTMVSFEVTDSVKDNKLPIESKEINVQIPTINNQKPVTITVAGEGIEKEENNGVLKVTKNYATNELEGYEWDSTNKFTVTYIYNTQTESAKVTTSASVKALTILGDVLEANTTNNEYEVNAEVGSIVRFETNVPKELGKGYIYTNINRPEDKLETAFNVNHKINIGLADLTDKIILEEGNIVFSNEDSTQTADATSYVTTKRIGILEEELVNALGEEGRIIVKDNNSNELGILDKNNLELELNASNLALETSKPLKEGIINIYEIKAITGDSNLTVSDLLALKSLTIQSRIGGFDNDNLVTSDETIATISLTEPTSNGSIDISTDNLSTVTANNDVTFSVVLNTTDINDALYVDPTIKINFPEEVTSITPKSAKIIYDDQLVIDKIETVDRSLVFSLKGTQNKYNTLETTKGTLLQFVADIGVNSFASSNQTKITMECTNEFTSETKTAEKNINIVAPYGMITTNQIDIDDKSVFAMNNDVEPILVKHNEEEKTMKITGQFINNTGVKAEQVSIVGRIPSSGNKTLGGVDLGTTINTTLASPVEVEGLDNYSILYSNNIEETVDGQGWQDQATSDSKSFKIVLASGAENRAMGKFSYTVSIPENIGYEKNAKENFGIYFIANTDGENKQYYTESKTLGIQTGLEPAIKIGVTAVDTNQGYALDNNGEIQEGQYVSYRVKVSNTGTETANDVAIAAKLPDGLTLIMPEQDTKGNTMVSYRDSSSKLLLQEVGSIAGGDSATYEFTTRVDGKLTESEKNSGNGKKLVVGVAVSADILGEDTKSATYILNSKPGYFGLKLASDVVGTVEADKEINYQLTLNNANYDNKTNTNIMVKLPNNVVYSSIDSKYENSIKYDQRANILLINLGTVNGNSKEIINFKAKNMNYGFETLSTEAELKCDGLEGEIKSNKVQFTTEASKTVIQASQTFTKNDIEDSEEFEFYTDITNNGISSKEIRYRNEIPSELEVIEYKITRGGTLINEGSVNYIDEDITVDAQSTVRVLVRAKPFSIETGKDIVVENAPSITLADGSQLNVKAQSIKIRGTSNRQTSKTTDEGSIKNSLGSNGERTYRITGNVWIEQIIDGIKGINDETLQELKMVLFNADENHVVLNEDGEEIVAYTDEYGNYEFENVKSGNYFVVALYDDLLYEVANYKADNVDETLNSDFVKAILNNSNVAATDIISVIDTNVNNIDLGLVKKELFDLAIDQTVSKISITSSEGTRTLEFDDEIADVDLTSKELEDSTSVVEYNVKVSNVGDVAGYAKSLMSYIPAGMTFNSQMNPDWYQTKDGVLHCVSIAEEIIQPGESKDIKLILSKKNGNNVIGLTRGKAEIGRTYNEQGLNEISALAQRYERDESNITSSRIVTRKKSSVKTLAVIAISIVVIGLIGLTGYEVKKRVFDKLYNIDNIE